jgi:hypothetical protein
MTDSNSEAAARLNTTSTRSSPLPLRLVAGVKAASCHRCHRTIALHDPEVCLWWPNGCGANRQRQPRPKRCWSCMTEDQRADMVDRGCTLAVIEVCEWASRR